MDVHYQRRMSLLTYYQESGRHVAKKIYCFLNLSQRELSVCLLCLCLDPNQNNNVLEIVQKKGTKLLPG